MQHIAEATFWVALGKIIWVNILLSGDNAVVIALAARNLPESQRNKAVLFGSAAAILLRVVLTLFAVELLHYPYLKIVGAALLFWIGVQLLVPERDGEGDGIKSSEHLFTAIRTILLADLVMSLDNVIAVAAAAESGPPESRTLLLIIGLGLSIPLIIFGSQLLMRVMERYPIIITLGAALLGYVAGEMLVHDQAVEKFFIGIGGATTTIVELAGAVGVVLVGRWLAARALAEAEAAAVAAAPPPAAPAAVHIKRVLVAVDASAAAAHAVRHLIGLRDELRSGVAEVHLVNVQRALPGETSIAVPAHAAENYHHERSEQALAPARALLDAAGIPYQTHALVGDPGARIAQLAKEQACDMIVMGTRGLGSHTGALLGSVAQATLEHAQMPVLLVK